jgi:hypothetical protein
MDVTKEFRARAKAARAQTRRADRVTAGERPQSMCSTCCNQLDDFVPCAPPSHPWVGQVFRKRSWLASSPLHSAKLRCAALASSLTGDKHAADQKSATVSFTHGHSMLMLMMCILQ